MPGDLRKVSLLAIVLLVVLRVSIGWHLMYEGLWKLSTQKTSNPWSAEGYLKNATGPMRPTFRAMTGDPDDLKWLDFDGMTKKWQAWRERFAAHYHLDESTPEGKQFNRLLDGPNQFEVPLAALPPGLDLAKVGGVNNKAVRFDAESKLLVVDGKLHLLPAERDRLIAAAASIAESNAEAKRTCDQFITAVKRAYNASSQLSINEQLVALLKQDPDRVGVMYDVKEGDKIPVVVGEVQYYKDLIERFKSNYAKAHTKFEWDHIDRQWTELQSKRREVIGPVQALEKKMLTEADELLSPKQLSSGPVPEPMTPIRQINWRTMWGLTIVGLFLMLGLFTRLSALGGAALLSLFYLAMPPWPGVQEIPSIEHNLFVNKIFVEMLALLAIGALPSGKWFGVDAIISLLFTRKPKK